MRRILILLVTLMIFTSTAFAQGKRILYVPIDSRPCNFEQVTQVAEQLDYELLTPPVEALGTRTNMGDVEAMWRWLDENASQADIAVLSTDALIYGSLVASRTHDLDKPTIMSRAERFKTFREKFPYLTTYVFGTIMRTPRTGNNSSAEPEYYRQYGAKIFQLTALIDKREMNLLTHGDQRKLTRLEAEIPQEYLDDWFTRRAKNSDVNELFVEYTRAGIFQYFLLGCDDSAEFSQTHRESRRLTELSSDLGKTVVQVTSGADELGMLMVARAINYDKNFTPFVSVAYNAGTGAKTFPPYCNEPIGVSVDAAIVAVGGLRIPAHERADLVVAVNTRENGKTFEASNLKRNNLKRRDDLKTFMSIVDECIAKNFPVAIADVAFANGADNALMNQLKVDGLQYKIRAYGGWNTATNSSGFLIGAGVLTKFMDDKSVAELLTTRYLDDWIYQANVRDEVMTASYGMSVSGDLWNLDEKLPACEQLLNERMKSFAAENLLLPSRWRLEDFRVTLPWQRTFECYPQFKLG